MVTNKDNLSFEREPISEVLQREIGPADVDGLTRIPEWIIFFTLRNSEPILFGKSNIVGQFLDKVEPILKLLGVPVVQTLLLKVFHLDSKTFRSFLDLNEEVGTEIELQPDLTLELLSHYIGLGHHRTKLF